MNRSWNLSGAVGSALLLAGCGGGGGVSSTPSPTDTTTTTTTDPVVTTPNPVTPTPVAPTPVTTPTVNYNDAEYQRSNASVAANALAAYNAGAIGAGIRIAVIDSGLTDPGTEFTGRIDPASRGFGGNIGYADDDGHGTSVAGVAAAGRDGSQTEGMALGATILALRADTAGTCASSGGCTYSSTTLATAIDYATTNGATVINLSLGADTAAPATLRNALSRATLAGVIVVMAAGNEGGADPELLAQVAADTSVSHGLIVIAGAHDGAFAISSFSNRAGIDANFYLTALGTRVRGFDNSGTAYLYSGTSYSTPAIAGAVALLRGAFPNLTAAQTIDLLYRSATDLGAAGIDTTFGRGALNLTKAFQPAGATSLAGSAIPVSLDTNATLGPAMGDALATGTSLGKTVILDGYGRAFALSLGATIGTQARSRPLMQAIGGLFHRSDMARGGAAMSMTIAGAGFAAPPTLDRPAPVDATGVARIVGSQFAQRLDRRNVAAFATASSGADLARQVRGGARPAGFLIARRPGDTPGFATRDGLAFAFRHDVGSAGLTTSAETGRLAGAGRHDPVPPRYRVTTLGIDRQSGMLGLSAAGGLMDEAGSVLGSRFGGALGGGGTRTWSADVEVTLAPGDGWTIAGSWRRAWTRMAQAGAMAGAGRLTSGAFAADLARPIGGGRFGLRLAQPLRVRSGGYRLTLPTDYDYATGLATTKDRRLDLAPAGRERTIEAAWGRPLGLGWLDANIYLRHEPGNIATAPDDRGAVLRYSARW